MFSETALDLRELDIAEIEGIMFVFAISLLGAIIQDNGIKERSVFDYSILELLYFIFILFYFLSWLIKRNISHDVTLWV